MSKFKRRIVMYNQASADGYFAAADGGLDWVVREDAVHEAALAGMPETDAMIFGRHTYERFESFWPHALDDSATAADPHAPGQRSEAMRAMAVWINDTTKFVFSKTRKSVTWKNSKLLAALEPRAIEDLKQQPGKDLIIFGSGSIVTQLTRHGLIDDYHFVVSPVLLGRGRNLLGELPQLEKLALRDARSFASGVVLLRYSKP